MGRAIVSLKLSEVPRDRRLQQRDMDEDDWRAVAAEYAQTFRQAVEEGEPNPFPPVRVIKEGKKYWLYDGFTRHLAYEIAGEKRLDVEVRAGTFRDALFLSAAANKGLRTGPKDRKRAALVLLKDLEWSKLSDRKIALHCGLSAMSVGNYRRELRGENKPPSGGVKILHPCGVANAEDDLVSSLPADLAAAFASLSPAERQELLEMAQADGAMEEEEKRTRTKPVAAEEDEEEAADRWFESVSEYLDGLDDLFEDRPLKKAERKKVAAALGVLKKLGAKYA